MSRRLVLLLVVVASLAVTGAGVFVQERSGSRPVAADSNTATALDAPRAHKGDGLRLQSPLAQISRAVDAYGLEGASIVAQDMGIEIEGGVRVIVKAAPGRASEVVQSAASLGATVESSNGDLLQIRMPVSSLASMSQREGVQTVRLPLRPVVADEITGKGVAEIGATEWHQAGMTGAGARIAVFDLGFEGYESLLGSELPQSVTVHSCREDGDLSGEGEPHGTAVAEIVHEVAPDASLFLANFDTEVGFANCIAWFVEQDIDIVNMAVGFFASGPGDGTGVINEMIDEATSNGLLWVNSAGNEAGSHWQGPWSDPDADDFLNFFDVDETNYVDAREGDFITILLKWDDPFGMSCNDYDLYLFEPSVTTIVAGSEDFQDFCFSDLESIPVEGFSYQVPVTGRYHIAVASFFSDGLANFHLYSFNQGCPVLQYCSASSSLVEPADHPDVLTVGAVPWNDTDQVEAFSSQGPTEDGRIKPDLVAPDGVSNVTFGSFFGTSASVAHAAGAAALVTQWHPEWDRQQIKEFLLSLAIDIDEPGPDNVSGTGLLNLGMPKPTPTPTNTPTATPSPTPTVTPTPTATATPLGPPGDVDCDRIVTSIDAALLLQFSAALIQELPCEAGADVNEDGHVDARDAAFIMRMQAGFVG